MVMSAKLTRQRLFFDNTDPVDRANWLLQSDIVLQDIQLYKQVKRLIRYRFFYHVYETMLRNCYFYARIKAKYT